MIQDYGRGLIIGDTSTFGKGTVQQIVMINDHVRRRDRQSAAAEPRRPQADDPAVLPGQRREHPDQRRAPAHPHPLDERPARLRRREDGQRLQVRQGRRLAARQLSTASPPIWSPSSNERSAERRKADPKFQKLDEQIKKFIERKARHSISLNEAKFRSEYVPEDPEEKAADEKAKKDRKKKKYIEREVWASDFYNDEVIHIVTDYLTLGLEGPRRRPRAGQDRRPVMVSVAARFGERPDKQSGLSHFPPRQLSERPLALPLSGPFHN